ncbi:hypothetical protein ACFL27_27495, partial [candidate division CSSED10-310 bacterium]
MVSNMLAVPAESGDFSRYLFQQSEGNPFFVAEYIRAAVEEGMLHRNQQGTWLVGTTHRKADDRIEYQKLPVPKSLKDLVSRRLEGLQPSSRSVLKVAAVVGREVRIVLLRNVVELTETSFMEAIEELLRRSLVEESEPEVIRFEHDKIREVAYELLNSSERTQCHLLIARKIEKLWSSDLAPYYKEIAYHYDHAKDKEKAVKYYTLAAHYAQNQHAHADAISYFSRALELIPPHEKTNRFNLLINREDVFHTLGDRAKQKQNLAALQELVESLKEKSLQTKLLIAQSRYAEVIGSIK